ncbi:MAG: MFS transporter [Gammaproteobacteria bacterium]|nr:MFS transporter [Gammaproteobacteria bacterium]
MAAPADSSSGAADRPPAAAAGSPQTVDTLLALLDAAPLNRRYWLTMGLVMTQFVCEIFDFFVVSFMVAVLAPQWQLTFGQSTIMLLTAGIGTIFGALLFGWLGDRYGRKAAMVGGAVLYCTAAGAIALIPEGDWVLFAALRFLVGAGYGGAGPGQFSLIVEFTPTRHRTFMGGLVTAPTSIGLLLASGIVAIGYPAIGWRGIAALGFLPIVIAIAIAFLAPESVRWLLANGRVTEARATLAKFLGRPLDELPVLLQVAPPRPGVPARELLQDPRRLALLLMIYTGMAVCVTGVMLWGPTLLAQLLRISARQAATYFVYLSIVGLAGRLLFAWLAQRRGRVFVGQLTAYVTAAMLAAAGLGHDAFLGAVPLFIACLLVGQFFMDGSYSNLIPYAAEFYPVRLASLAMGLASAAGGAGKILGTVVLGLLAGAGNLVSPEATERGIVPGFLFLAGCAALTGLGFTWFGIETHGRALQLDQDAGS